MNNPIYNTTLKLIESLKNASGKYSEKNEVLIEIVKKCLALKGFGCNFVIGTEYGKDNVCLMGNGKKSDFHLSTKYLKINELSNLLSCLSVTMNDRAFVLTYNEKHNLIIFCIEKIKFRSDWQVSEKNATSEKTCEIENAITGKKSVIVEKTSKGKRDLNESDINALRTVFNSMLGIGYEKPLAEKVEKLA